MADDITVTIIDVDIGDINTIITDDLKEITDKNQQSIDSAIAASKLLDSVRDKRSQEDEARENAMTSIYQEMLDATNNNKSLPSKRIIELGTAVEITNMISFVGRMRNWLKVKGHQYKLASTKSGKETGYRLEAIDV